MERGELLDLISHADERWETVELEVLRTSAEIRTREALERRSARSSSSRTLIVPSTERARFGLPAQVEVRTRLWATSPYRLAWRAEANSDGVPQGTQVGLIDGGSFWIAGPAQRRYSSRSRGPSKTISLPEQELLEPARMTPWLRIMRWSSTTRLGRPALDVEAAVHGHTSSPQELAADSCLFVIGVDTGLVFAQTLRAAGRPIRTMEALALSIDGGIDPNVFLPPF